MNRYINLEPDLSGWLIPANDPLPEYLCKDLPKAPKIPFNAIRIYYGRSVGYTTKFPFNALVI
jgi:hypothetical protein